MIPTLTSGQPDVDPYGQQIFISGRDGYHTYRIPSIAVATKGTVLAVCEGRKNSSGDSGNIAILFESGIETPYESIVFTQVEIELTKHD
ncbi:MAG: exo-alpha-sialidase [Bacteroidales bacterium]|nr:exo-alpha-sialidase [Bacteroidales bacterium]